MYIDEQIQNFVRNSHFLNNKADLDGGALYLTHSTRTQVLDSVVSYNLANEGGGFHCNMGAIIWVSNTEFSYNQAI